MRWFLSLILLTLFISCKKEFPISNSKVLGHAGESLLKSKSKHPPNTLKSVDRALELGAEGVEVDVQITSDGVLVAYHDLSLEDNSDGEGCINSRTYADIQDITVYKSDEHIDLLEDILDLVLSEHKHIMLDVKHYNECEASKIDYAVFNDELNMLLSVFTPQQKELIVVNSSDTQLLNSLSDTIINKSLERDDLDVALIEATANAYDMLSIKLGLASQDKIDQIQNLGIKVSIFNVKIRSEIYEAFEFNPDFVISDNLPCTLKAING